MSSPLEVRAPSESSEGTRSSVLRWLKRVDEPVALNEPLLELETDKVTVEMPSPAAGVLREILKRAGDEVAPGDLLARLDAPAGVAPAAAADAAVVRSSAGSSGDGTRTDASLRPANAPAGRNEASARFGSPDVSPLVSELPAASSAAAGAAARLSPAVRRLLRERGVDPSEVVGSGKGGRITATDVERHSGADRSVAEDESIERIPHTPMRRRIAAHMTESLLRTAPHVTSVFEADLGALLAHRARHRAEFEARGAPLTLTAYFLVASVAAIREVPETNARWTENAIELHRSVHIGVATDLAGRGLVVPVLRDVDRLDLFGVAAGLAALTRRAREDRLRPEDVRGGTFTISNHGVSGSLVAAPIVIHQPQSAILGIGKLEKRVVVVESGGVEAIAIRPRCYLSLTIDHRVMDGSRANRFLATMMERLAAFD